MGNYIITLTEEEEKALLWDMKSIQEWLDNAIRNKARQCIDEICRLALEDKMHTILTLDEKRQLSKSLDTGGIAITSVKQLPIALKMQIVAEARIESATERQIKLIQ